MSYLPSQISCSYAGHPDFSAILLSLFPLTTLCVSFRNVPVHLWVLCATETLGCCSKASVAYWQKALGALWAVFHCRVTINSLLFSPSPPVREQRGTSTELITLITPLLGISLPPEIMTARRIYLSLFLPAALHSPTTCTQTQCSAVYPVTWPTCYSATPAAFLSIHFLCDNSYCNHGSTYFLHCQWGRVWRLKPSYLMSKSSNVFNFNLTKIYIFFFILIQ